MSFLDSMVSAMQEDDSEPEEKESDSKLREASIGIVKEAVKNCIWVRYSMYGEVVAPVVTRVIRGQDYSRVDVAAEPTLYVPSVLFKDLLASQTRKVNYPLKLKEVMDALQATRSKKVLGAKLQEFVLDVPDVSEQGRVIVVPLVPFFVFSGIDPLDFYPPQTHSWRYVNF